MPSNDDYDPAYEERCEMLRGKIEHEIKRKEVRNKIMREKKKRKDVTMADGKPLIGGNIYNWVR